VEEATELGEQRERLKRVLQGLEALLAETDAALESAGEQPPSADAVSRLEELRARLEESVREYLSENAAFVKRSREELRKIEEANRKAAMAEQRSRPERDEARFQALSGELATELRLERVDKAIKELLDFLSDAEFFAANASTGRRRRLRALQNAIEKALAK